jgi:hypothetical protein
MTPCVACKYWVRDEVEGSPLGECRRHAPLPVTHEVGEDQTYPQILTVWPTTDEGDGCGDGEFRP